jgi:hypothetical protein
VSVAEGARNEDQKAVSFEKGSAGSQENGFSTAGALLERRWVWPLELLEREGAVVESHEARGAAVGAQSASSLHVAQAPALESGSNPYDGLRERSPGLCE